MKPTPIFEFLVNFIQYQGLRAQSATAMAVPIATGEDTLQVRVTVGFEITR